MFSRVTSLARSVVPWHSATAWALSASFIVFVSASIAHGAASGARGGIAVFLAWTIVRELAPRRAIASLLVPFTAVAFAIPADTDLLASTGALLVARIAARSVGDAPTRLDAAVLIAMAAWLATRPEGLPVALVLAAIVFADAPPTRSRIVGIVMLVAALAVGSVEGTLTLQPEWSDLGMAKQVLLAFTGAAAAWLLVVPLPKLLRPHDDRRRGHLLGVRIRSARIGTVACVVAVVAWTGTAGAFALAPAAAAVLAAGLGGARQRPAGGATAR